MKKLTVFLASSEELAQERKDFADFMYQRSQALGILINTIMWETSISNSMSKTCLQDKYNEIIPTCDMFVGLFFTKVGKYTEGEFDTAWKSFNDSEKPLIFTYFKETDNKQASLQEFWDKLWNLGHFPTMYKNTEELQLKFWKELEDYLGKNVIKSGKTVRKTVQHANKIINIGKIKKAKF